MSKDISNSFLAQCAVFFALGHRKHVAYAFAHLGYAKENANIFRPEQKSIINAFLNGQLVLTLAGSLFRRAFALLTVPTKPWLSKCLTKPRKKPCGSATGFFLVHRNYVETLTRSLC